MLRELYAAIGILCPNGVETPPLTPQSTVTKNMRICCPYWSPYSTASFLCLSLSAGDALDYYASAVPTLRCANQHKNTTDRGRKRRNIQSKHVYKNVCRVSRKVSHCLRQLSNVLSDINGLYSCHPEQNKKGGPFELQTIPFWRLACSAHRFSVDWTSMLCSACLLDWSNSAFFWFLFSVLFLSSRAQSVFSGIKLCTVWLLHEDTCLHHVHAHQSCLSSGLLLLPRSVCALVCFFWKV